MVVTTFWLYSRLLLAGASWHLAVSCTAVMHLVLLPSVSTGWPALNEGSSNHLSRFLSLEKKQINILLPHYFLMDYLSRCFCLHQSLNRLTTVLSTWGLGSGLKNRVEIPPQRSAVFPRGWCPPSSPVNINLHEFLRGGLLFAFEIELCQNKEMREVCREERDEMRWDLGSSGGGECEAQLECQETNLAVIVRKWEWRGFGGRGREERHAGGFQQRRH